MAGHEREILIVDDNADAADGLSILLRMAGYRTTVAHDGREALEAIARLQPAVLLLDIGLPDMDGYELCRRAREAGAAEALIVAVTGRDEDRDRELAAEAGFDVHVVKPVEFDELLGVITRGRAGAWAVRRSPVGAPLPGQRL